MDGIGDTIRRLEALADAEGSAWESQICDEILQRIRRRAHFPSDDEKPLFCSYFVNPLTLASTGFPDRLAAAVYGDESLVYDVANRLRSFSYDLEIDPLNGSPVGYEPLPGESLVRFIEVHGRGVVFLDDSQLFSKSVIEFLASICDNDIVTAFPGGSPLHKFRVHDMIFLIGSRVALPTVAEVNTLADLDSRPPSLPTASDKLFRRGLPAWFEQTIIGVLKAKCPAHFSHWVCARMGHFDCTAVWEQYVALLQASQFDQPILPQHDDIESAPPPSLGLSAEPKNLVDDVAAIVDREPQFGKFDVFIGYSWNRTSDDANRLRNRLVAAGLSVFFDKDRIDISSIPDDEMKAYLVHLLRWAVRSSRCCIFFAAAARPYRPTPGFNSEVAVNRGLAMISPTDTDVLIEWSWQGLEISNAGNALVIDDRRVYAIKYDSDNEDFGSHYAPDWQAVEALVDHYLVNMAILDVDGNVRSLESALGENHANMLIEYTEETPVACRQSEVDHVINLLANDKSVLLVGEFRVGKDAVVTACKRTIDIQSDDTQERPWASLYGPLALSRYHAGRIVSDARSIKNQNGDNRVVVYITNLGKLLATDRHMLAQLFDSLASHDLQVIGEVYPEQLEAIGDHAGEGQIFEIFTVTEPQVEEAVEMVTAHLRSLETHHGIRYANDAARAAVAWAPVIGKRPLPWGAISLLNHIGAGLAHNRDEPNEVRLLRSKIRDKQRLVDNPIWQRNRSEDDEKMYQGYLAKLENLRKKLDDLLEEVEQEKRHLKTIKDSAGRDDDRFKKPTLLATRELKKMPRRRMFNAIDAEAVLAEVADILDRSMPELRRWSDAMREQAAQAWSKTRTSL